MNRILLAVVGLSMIAAGGYVLARAMGVGLPGIPRPDDATLWIALAAAALLVALCLAWVLTRGRGRISRLLVVVDHGGTTVIETTVAADLMADALAADPDIVTVSSTGFRMRGSSVLSIRVTARRGADLAAVIRTVGATVENLDGVLEQRFPVLLQVASGVRATLARENRTR